MVDRHRADDEDAPSEDSSWTTSGSDDGDVDDELTTDAVGVVPFGLSQGQLSPGPTFNNVAVANSTDVQFGNKTFFNGPVTIKQIVYAKDVEDAASSAVPAASSGASVTRVDPESPGGSRVFAEGVEVKVREPVFVANGNKATPSNGAGPTASRDSNNCCHIPAFTDGGKTGVGKASCWRSAWQQTSRKNLAFCGVAVGLVVCGVILTAASALRGGRGDAGAPGVHQEELPGPWLTPETNVTLSGKLRLIPRFDWLAQPARAREFLKPPVHYVIISHSASEGCSTQAACVAMVRNMQTFHIESRGWSDIAYNFMVGGDGYVYVGRGWDVVGAHTYGYNNRSVGLNMVGTFIDALPPERQLLALQQLIELGVSEGHIAEDYKLLAHRQLSATESPGAKLFEELKTWPHWSPKP